MIVFLLYQVFSVFSPVQEKYHEYEPLDHDKNKGLIRFVTTNQKEIKIFFDPNKTMRELIKFYFDEIKRGDLVKVRIKVERRLNEYQLVVEKMKYLQGEENEE